MHEKSVQVLILFYKITDKQSITCLQFSENIFYY